MDQAPRAHHLCWRHRGEVPWQFEAPFTVSASSLSGLWLLHAQSLTLIRSTAQHHQACCAVLGYSLA